MDNTTERQERHGQNTQCEKMNPIGHKDRDTRSTERARHEMHTETGEPACTSIGEQERTDKRHEK
eukprot:2568609-Prorocentrum_lima.AAC.1